MLGKLFGGGDPVKAFWDWFEKNEEKVFNVETGQEPIVRDLIKRLRKVHPSLTFQAGPVEGGQQLEISADGDRSAFSAVEELVAAAPVLARWRVLAFRQRAPQVERIQIGDFPISVDEIFFKTTPDEGKLALELYIEGFNEEQRDLYGQASFILLDAVLGEYDVETKISSIDFEALASYAGGEPLRPMRELAGVVDSMPAGSS